MRYHDRRHAGQLLAEALTQYAGPDTIVLGLPRGGVIVAREVAKRLGAPLDVLIVRKLGAPGNPEYAMGAMAEVGEPRVDRSVLRQLGGDEAFLEREIAEARQEIARRQALYREGQPLPSLEGKQALLVDDGIATGYTMLVAAIAVRQAGASWVVAAAPVGSPEAERALRLHTDEIVLLQTPSPFYAVGLYYDEFSQITDEEVRAALGQSDMHPTGQAA